MKLTSESVGASCPWDRFSLLPIDLSFLAAAADLSRFIFLPKIEKMERKVRKI